MMWRHFVVYGSVMAVVIAAGTAPQWWPAPETDIKSGRALGIACMQSGAATDTCWSGCGTLETWRERNACWRGTESVQRDQFRARFGSAE